MTTCWCFAGVTFTMAKWRFYYFPKFPNIKLLVVLERWNTDLAFLVREVEQFRSGLKISQSAWDLNFLALARATSLSFSRLDSWGGKRNRLFWSFTLNLQERSMFIYNFSKSTMKVLPHQFSIILFRSISRESWGKSCSPKCLKSNNWSKNRIFFPWKNPHVTSEAQGYN